MARVPSGKRVGVGVAVAALAAGGAAVAGGAASSASTAHRQAASAATGRLRPADHQPGGPGSHGGTTLTIGAPPAGGSAGSPTTGTVIAVSSYDFVDAVGGSSASAGSPTGAVAANTLVVTTSLDAQSELASLTASAGGELVAHGEGASALDATFAGLSLQRYEISSDSGGTLTLTFGFSSVTLAAPTSVPTGTASSTGGTGSTGSTGLTGSNGSTGSDGGSSSRGRG